MSAFVRSLRRFGAPQLAAMTLVLSACATAEEPDEQGNRGGSPPAAGGAGTAGSPPAVAGSNNPGTSGSPGSSGSPPTSGGGTTGGSAAGGTGTGGTSGTGTAGSGGMSGGGSPPATGGAPAGSCPQYTGTKATDSLIFTNGFGASTVGMWKGYGYTYKYGTATTIAPGSTGTGCFVGAKFCANGTVANLDTEGAGLGWNIAQVMGATTPSKVAITTPVKVSFSGVTAGMRVQLSASPTVSYCYTLTAADVTAGTATIPAASFKTDCWGELGMAYDGTTPIEAIQIAIPGSAAAAAPQAFDICVTDLEPG